MVNLSSITLSTQKLVSELGVDRVALAYTCQHLSVSWARARFVLLLSSYRCAIVAFLALFNRNICWKMDLLLCDLT